MTESKIKCVRNVSENIVNVSELCYLIRIMYTLYDLFYFFTIRKSKKCVRNWQNVSEKVSEKPTLDWLTPDYFEYLKSDTWAKKRKAALKRAGYRCQYCGKKGGVLQVHHKTYARFGGKEKPSDLKVACLTCHQIADNERRYNAGLHTYLIKKYGANWQDYIPVARGKVEFDLWLKSKQ